MNILLVDSHETTRFAISSKLKACRNKFKIKEVEDGEEALKTILKTKPDLIFMGISLPNLSGLEIARQISEKAVLSKVVIVSEFFCETLLHYALRIGARGYLSKTSCLKEIKPMLKTVKRGEIFVSPIITDKIPLKKIDITKKSPIEYLSSREREVMKMVVEGKTSIEISEKLLLSPKSIESYRSRLMNKLEVRNITDLTKFAVAYGIISATEIANH